MTRGRDHSTQKTTEGKLDECHKHFQSLIEEYNMQYYMCVVKGPLPHPISSVFPDGKDVF